VNGVQKHPARVALVTGAGQRVGRAIAETLAARGWRVALHHHASREGAVEAVQGIRARGGEAEAFAADLRNPAEIEAMIGAVAHNVGALDLLVNSAASMERTPIGAVTGEAFDQIIALNLRAPFLLAQAASRVMRDGASIVNIADHMATEPWPDYAVHGIAKAGVIAMTRHLASELAPRLRVNAVAPGFVLAPPGSDPAFADKFAEATPLKRIGSPADVADAVCYFADATYVTGETLFVDGGRHVRG
jgi:pteridine reductase